MNRNPVWKDMFFLILLTQNATWWCYVIKMDLSQEKVVYTSNDDEEAFCLLY